MKNVCTLTITSDEIEDKIELEVNYGADTDEISLSPSNQAQQAIYVIAEFANQLLSGTIPNELVLAIMSMGKEVNVDEN
jgi:hypothetical protein